MRLVPTGEIELADAASTSIQNIALKEGDVFYFEKPDGAFRAGTRRYYWC